ncbi:hypothetical protein ABGB16_16065 [Micromonospora sp. B11E3]|uniref:hypothetical protein n=1 Tax=Micromonospora sp. B11E3 TaxID=3153562 RepID=UPI00325F400E
MITEADTGQVAKRGPARPAGDGVDDQLVAQVVERARAAGLQLTGEDMEAAFPQLRAFARSSTRLHPR